MDFKTSLNERRPPNLRMSVAALPLLAVLLAGCFPPSGPVTPASAPATEATPMPSESDWQATSRAGVALVMNSPTGSQVLLQPADMIIAALSFQGFRDELRDGNVPEISATTTGCVSMALLAVNGDESPMELVYADLLAGQIISPTAWSEYGVYTTTIRDEVAYVAGPPIEIASTRVYTPTGSCSDQLDANLENLFQDTEGMALTARRLMLSVEKDGTLQTYFVIIEPAQPEGCRWVLSQCSGCRRCGYEVVCKVVKKYLCKR